MANNENLIPFKKGEDPRRANSGRKPLYLTALLNKTLKRKREIIIEGIDIETNLPVKIRIEGHTKEEVINALVLEAANGNIQAIREILDRVEGKATQAIEVKNAEGESFNITLNLNPK